ncbi:MAG: hypothetical protein MUC62_06530 [Candidatus Thermoplasmatota archaeon]|jgi:hypothetical protein|nr:hypothetical protein [Candidatus Thermoplasmatota archaeon]
MGKTCPTYRMLLDEEIASWEQFRRALRKEDREAFDELMDSVRTRASASSNAARLNPFESMVMAALVELMRKHVDHIVPDEDGPV